VARFPKVTVNQDGLQNQRTIISSTDAEGRQFIAHRMKENPNQEFVTIGPEFGVMPMNGVEYRHA
jgi:hypothetical protein